MPSVRAAGHKAGGNGRTAASVALTGDLLMPRDRAGRRVKRGSARYPARGAGDRNHASTGAVSVVGLAADLGRFLGAVGVCFGADCAAGLAACDAGLVVGELVEGKPCAPSAVQWVDGGGGCRFRFVVVGGRACHEVGVRGDGPLAWG